jgi:hypothetical protein
VGGVLPQFGVSVPGGNVKGEIKDNLVMFFRKQTLKYRDTALRALSVFCLRMTSDTFEPTWRISSKLLAAGLFSAETLPPNLRMVSRPNVGT